MEKIMIVSEEVKQINNIYKLSNDEIDRLQYDMRNAKVCTPIIGKFSSGKSALINAFLGYKDAILKENIVPETAIPTEISYADEDCCKVIYSDGNIEQIPLADYRKLKCDVSEVKSIKLGLCNDCLRAISDVMLVDMPGFESGYEVHNIAIDNYLPESLAYIIAFPADDMILRSSIVAILKELSLNNMPICIVITKCDKKAPDFDIVFEKLMENLKRYVGNINLYYCFTSAHNGEIGDLENFFNNIQKQSQNLLGRKFKNSINTIIQNTENYLNLTLKNSQISESELDAEEEKLQNKLNSLDENFEKEKDKFQSEMADIVDVIKGDIQIALEQDENTLVTMAMNEQPINGHLNSLIRNVVSISIKKHFTVNAEKYLKRISDCLNNVSIDDVHITFDENMHNLTSGIVVTAAAITGAKIAAGLAVSAAAAGTAGAVSLAATGAAGGAALGPVGMAIGAAVAGIGGLIFSKVNGDKKREEVKSRIREKLRNEVFPQILSEVGNAIEISVDKQVDLINTSIQNEFIKQKNILEQAMNDIRNRMNLEKDEKMALESGINDNLIKISELKTDIESV